MRRGPFDTAQRRRMCEGHADRRDASEEARDTYIPFHTETEASWEADRPCAAFLVLEREQ